MILPTTTMCMHNMSNLLPHRPSADHCASASASCQLTYAQPVQTHISSHAHTHQDADCSVLGSQRASHSAPQVPMSTRNPLHALELLATLLAEHGAVASRIAAGRRVGEPAPVSSNDDLWHARARRPAARSARNANIARPKLQSSY